MSDHRPTLSRVVTTGIGIATTGVLPAFLVGALAVRIASELGFGPSGLGMAVASFYLGSTVMSASFGRLAERLGWSRSMRIGGVACAVTSVAIGVVSNSLAILSALLFAAGAVNALSQPAVNLFLSRTVPLDRQGLVFGLKQAAIPLGTMLAGASVPLVVLLAGWRWSFAAAGALALLSGLAVPHDNRPAAEDQPFRGDAHRAPALPVPFGPLAWLAAGTGLGQAAVGVLAAFLVTTAVTAGFAEAHAGALLAGGSIAGLVVRIVAGWTADRFGAGWGTVGWLLVVGSLGLLLIATGNPALILVGAVLGFGAGWGWPGLFNFAVVRHYPDTPAAATSITQIGVYVGNGIGPALFGLIALHSFGIAWLVSAILAVLAALIVLRVGRLLAPALAGP